MFRFIEIRVWTLQKNKGKIFGFSGWWRKNMIMIFSKVETLTTNVFPIN
jgi:hypothetical protein